MRESVLIWAVCSVLAMTTIVRAAEPAPDDGLIEDTRETLEKWVQTRHLISQEKQDWALGREMLEERIDLVQREIASLREKIAQAEASISEADEKRAELLEENEALKRSAQALQDVVAGLEGRTSVLIPRLPDPIRERIRPLSQRLPKEGDEKKQSLGKRFENVIGILNEVNKFNHEIAVTSEVRNLPDGTTAEVTAMYLGLGQAYYTGANGTVAGIGRPAADGWTWEQANEVAQPIADAVAILKNEKVAAFVPLPVNVDDAREVLPPSMVVPRIDEAQAGTQNQEGGTR